MESVENKNSLAQHSEQTFFGGGGGISETLATGEIQPHFSSVLAQFLI